MSTRFQRVINISGPHSLTALEGKKNLLLTITEDSDFYQGFPIWDFSITKNQI